MTEPLPPEAYARVFEGIPSSRLRAVFLRP